MASFTTIPVEIVLEIVKLILNQSFDLPTVGGNAAWVVPRDSGIHWTHKSGFRKIIKGVIPWSPPGEVNGDKRIIGWRTPTGPGRFHCTLKALRRTNHFFDDICKPILYRQLNLLSNLRYKNLEMFTELFDAPKWSLVQSISIYVDPSEPARKARFTEQARVVGLILEHTQNLTSLAIYYRIGTAQMTLIKEPLLSLLQKGKLSTLGFYSYPFLRYRTNQDEEDGKATGLIDLLDSIALYEPARRSLRVLDVVADDIPTRTFDSIRSNFASLTSLTLRGVVRPPRYLNRIWDVDERPKWHSYPNLTRLQLANFQPAHAAHIPPLVGHFKALKELTISACGEDEHFGMQRSWQSRPRGWSRLPDALCNSRSALTMFHVEHMYDYEINELGVIPTATLMATTVKKHNLLETFRQDPEIFPGLRTLRLAPLPTSGDHGPEEKDKGNVVDGEPSIQAICSVRDIQLRRDAITYLPCVCGSANGY